MIGKPSARFLGVLDIGQPLVEEGREIVVIESRWHEEIHIPGVAAALVALIAVSWNTHDVGPHRPLDIAHKF